MFLFCVEEKKKKKKKKSKTKKENSQQSNTGAKELYMASFTECTKSHRTISESSETELSEIQRHSSKKEKKKLDKTQSSSLGETRSGKRKRNRSDDGDMSTVKVKKISQKDNVHSAKMLSAGLEDSKGSFILLIFPIDFLIINRVGKKILVIRILLWKGMKICSFEKGKKTLFLA